MKTSTLLPLITFLIAPGASAACVDGHIETITPDYKVEYKCGQYRTGVTHKKIQSERDCALLCKDSPQSVCSYSPSLKFCVVGDENGTDRPKAGITYMSKYDDPFVPEDEKDPFEPTCEEERDELLDQIAQLKQNGGSGQGSGGNGSCVHMRRVKNEKGLPVKTAGGVANCQKACRENPECKSWQYYGSNNICNNFAKAVEDMESGPSGSDVLMNIDCAVSF